MSDKEYAKDAQGTHIMNPLQAEYTLCGYSFDNHYTESGELKYKKTGPVTCPNCIRVIKELRGVRIQEQP